MVYFSLTLLISFLVTLFVIKNRHLKKLLDEDLSSPQKMHKIPVPRIGGLGIYISLCILALYLKYINQPNLMLNYWLLSSIPVFFLGLIEDLTKSVTPKIRLLGAASSCAISIYLTQVYITRVDINIIDKNLLLALPIAYLFTAFAISGVINSINIIDGMNGLASIVACVMLLSLAYVGWKIEHIDILLICLACIGAVLGFFIFNFPRGFIFLGDGGAYFMGFMLAQIAIYLVYKSKTVSAWYPVLLFIYPIFETVFSIYRKKFLRGISPGIPDGVHLHMLVYKRLMRWMIGSNINSHIVKRNSFTSIYLWVLSAMAVIPATLFYNNTFILQIFCLIFIISYIWLYVRIIKFRSPKWLIIQKKYKNDAR